MTPPRPHPTTGRRGFTLLEVLLSLLILSIMSLMIFGSFSSIIETTAHAEEVINSLHHGEVVMDQLVSSLRSASFFDSNPGLFTFQHEPGTANPPNDMLSWVTGTMSLLPPQYPTRQGLNRIFLSIEEIDGVRGLAVSAYPHLVDPEDLLVEDVPPWVISPRVHGLRIRFYNPATEEWEDEWEDERQIPQFLELTLYLEPLEERGPLRELVRRIDVPVGRISRETRRGRRQPNPDTGTPTESAPPGTPPSGPAPSTPNRNPNRPQVDRQPAPPGGPPR